jgi:hypothetical protein
MKKTLLVLTVLALAVPAMAAVSIDVNDLGGGVAAIEYTADANMSAFGLKVSVDAGTITAVSPNKVGESNSTAKGFGIFLGTIDINSTTGLVDNYGSPVAPNSDPGAGGTGLDTNTVVIELGALYEDGNQPPLSGTLCQVTVSECCKMTVTVEPTRCGETGGGQDAGAVQEDGTPVVPTLTGATAIDIDYNCGCACLGNISGDNYVTTVDLGMLYSKLGQYGATWTGAPEDKYKIPEGHALFDICGDMNLDHYITTVDLGMLYSKLGQYGATWTGAPEDKYKIPCP